MWGHLVLCVAFCLSFLYFFCVCVKNRSLQPVFPSGSPDCLGVPCQ